jgi:hypothetical protein
MYLLALTVQGTLVVASRDEATWHRKEKRCSRSYMLLMDVVLLLDGEDMNRQPLQERTGNRSQVGFSRAREVSADCA